MLLEKCIYKVLFVVLEFASQLPHDGGAFYTTDTMDSCRPHYAASWPPLLHAVALWLNATQFKGENAQDRFHLLFGMLFYYILKFINGVI